MATTNWLYKAREIHPDFMGPVPVPEGLQDVELANLRMPILADCVLRYGEDFWTVAAAGVAPLFLGPPTRYKSFAAAVLVKACHRKLLPSAWCNVPVHLNQLERKRYSPESDKQIAKWTNVPFLVMDDFAMIQKDTWQYNVLIEIAMSRFDSSKPTCWTGNIDLKGKPTAQDIEAALHDCVGVQLTRRLLDRSEGYRLYVA